MRAAHFYEFGDPSVLRVEETDWPYPVNDEVLVRVHASSVNGTDLGLRRGEGPFALTTRRPFTPGFDIAGEVVRLGPKASAFDVGEKVYALLGHGGGGAAEYVAVRQARLARAPQSVPLVQAAAVPLAGLTALQALREGARLHLKPGARVLVNGASGGIGSFGVQLAKHYGAFVTGVARGEKLDFVRDLGADEVLDYKTQDFTRLGQQWDVIFDTPPSLQFKNVAASLSEHGTYVSTRPIPTSPQDLRGMLSRGGPRFAGVMTRERGIDLALLARLIDDGALRVPLDRTFTLDHIGEAHRYAEGDEVRGKVVVTV